MLSSTSNQAVVPANAGTQRRECLKYQPDGKFFEPRRHASVITAQHAV